MQATNHPYLGDQSLPSSSPGLNELTSSAPSPHIDHQPLPSKSEFGSNPEPQPQASIEKHSERDTAHSVSSTPPLTLEQEASHGGQLPTFNDLFFDLLFAAVLNVYSSAISFNNVGQVFGFIGFFSLLWWSWWTQTLFDVRFRRGGTHHPIWFKACQYIIRMALLGTWISFAATPSEFARRGFTNFSVIYTVTRACLLLDHLLILLEPVSRSHSNNYSIIALIASMMSFIISGLLWAFSRYFDERQEVSWQQLVMWLVGIATEVIVQFGVEWCHAFQSLGSTILVERMATFGLIVLGEGFIGVGEVINSLSPGSRNWERNGIPSGGWGSVTILNVICSLLVILMQFNAYFRDAVRELKVSSGTIMLIWCYVHLILHVSSAVTVIGLKKVIAFANSVVAFNRFVEKPANYLPATEQWKSITSDSIFDLLALDTSQLALNDTAAAALRIVGIIRSTSGADIPTVEQANALAEAGHAVHGVSFDAPLKIELRSFFEVAEATNDVNPQSFFDWISMNLFHFKYLYGACAIFLASDALVKAMRGYASQSLRKSAPVLICRFSFAVILSIIQVIFAVSPKAVDIGVTTENALAILAGVLIAEWLAYLIIELFINWKRQRKTKPIA